MKDDDVKNLEATSGNKLVRLSEREGRDLLNEDLDIVELSINEVNMKYSVVQNIPAKFRESLSKCSAAHP